jgi:endonuclease/exonuclease/phosphatase family metal-dependent hydrolase
MSETPRRIRIATYNVHSCVGRDGRHDPERTARVIEELDAEVVALQEFTYPADVAIETRTPVVLGALDGYQSALGPTHTRSAGTFGNILLTRHPIRELQRLDLSMDRCEPRGALAVTLDVDGVELHVLATHLGLRIGERRFQVGRILKHIESLQSKLLVVLGDFNDWLPGRSVVHVLEEKLGHSPKPRSFPVFCPILSLDRIWVHPAGALRELYVHKSAGTRRASDHLPVVAVIEVPRAQLDQRAIT